MSDDLKDKCLDDLVFHSKHEFTCGFMNGSACCCAVRVAKGRVEELRASQLSPAIVAAVRAYQEAHLSHESLLDAAMASDHAEKIHGSDIIESEGRVRLAMAQVRHYIEADAREELELLRELAFEVLEIRGMRSAEHCLECGFSGGDGTMREDVHNDKCKTCRLLRTDPERARKMGLGWAL